MSQEGDQFVGELRLGRQLSGVWPVTVAGLVALIGLIYLLGGHVPNASTSLAFVVPLLGAGTVVLTLLNILELLAGSGESGGSYGLAQEVLGGLGGFITGWLILGGQVLVLAACLRGVGDLVSAALPSGAPWAPWIGLAVLAGLALVQVMQALPRRPSRERALAILALLLILALLTAGGLAGPAPAPAAPGQAAPSLSRQVAPFALFYLAIETILFARRQIRNPNRDLVPSLGIAVLAAMALSVLALAVSFSPAALSAELHKAAGGQLGWLMAARTGAQTLIVLAVLLASAGAALSGAARSLASLSRRGGLPDWLRRIRRTSMLPPWLFLLPALAAAPLVGWGRVEALVEAGAAAVLAAMLFVDVAAFNSRRTEPERRRSLVLPLFPLFPLAAAGINFLLVLALPGGPHLALVVWLVVGAALYFAVARQGLVAAQEGVITFGRDQRVEKPEGSYRVLVPLGQGQSRSYSLQVAAAIAHQLGGDVITLQVITLPDPLAIEQGRRMAQERNTLFQWSTRLASETGVTITPITRISRSVAEGIVDTANEEACDLIVIPWNEARPSGGEEVGGVVDPVASQAPCSVAVVAYQSDPSPDNAVPPGVEVIAPSTGSSARGAHRIVVPTAGGPHTPLAIGLALLLGREWGAEVESVYVVEPGASPAEIQAGESRIRDTLMRFRENAGAMFRQENGNPALDPSQVRSHVVEAEDVLTGLVEAAEGSDLAFIGSSEEAFIDRFIFGNLPLQVASQSQSPVIMVRQHRGLPRFWLSRFLRAIFSAVPTVEDAEKITVYRQVRRDARPSSDFFIMMGLSAVLATLGLLQDSTAVIIGSMLVAPLFSPILAISLGVVQGDFRLLRIALEAALKGIALAVGLAVIVTLISPLATVTHEISVRTQPNLFDLAVALAAGAAGAYAIARKEVSAALPGVAIAVALVPPLGVVGFGLASGNFSLAGGSALLVLTNLIAIGFSGSIVLLLLGFQPGRGPARRANLRRGLIISVLLLLLIAIPLAAVFTTTIRRSRLQRQLQTVLAQQFADIPDARMQDFSYTENKDALQVEVTVWSSAGLSREQTDGVAKALTDLFDRPVTLTVDTVQVSQQQSSSP